MRMVFACELAVSGVVGVRAGVPGRFLQVGWLLRIRKHAQRLQEACGVRRGFGAVGGPDEDIAGSAALKNGCPEAPGGWRCQAWWGRGGGAVGGVPARIL